MSPQPFTQRLCTVFWITFPLRLVQSEFSTPYNIVAYTKLGKTCGLHSCLHSKHCLVNVFLFLICYRQLSRERKNIEEWQIAQIAFPVRMVGFRLQSIETLIKGECCNDTQYTTDIFYLNNALKCYRPCLLELLYRCRKLRIVPKTFDVCMTVHH